MSNKRRGIVISGGGSKGSFAVAIAKYLMNEIGKDYNYFIGTSTGSLITTLLAANQTDKLKEAYTSITQKDIFKINPFKIKNNELQINYINVIYNMLIKGNKTLGDSSNLRKLISKFVLEEDFNNIKKNNKESICCVTNLNTGKKEFKSTNHYEYDDFCDWIYASSCATPFMSTVDKDGYIYADGGFTDAVPIQKAIDLGCNEIDIIILRPENIQFEEFKYNNIVSLLARLIDIMIGEIGTNDVDISYLEAKLENIQLNFYYTPRVLTYNSLVFNKEEMNKWYQEGLLYAKNKICRSYILNNKKCELIHDGISDISSFKNHIC